MVHSKTIVCVAKQFLKGAMMSFPLFKIDFIEELPSTFDTISKDFDSNFSKFDQKRVTLSDYSMGRNYDIQWKMRDQDIITSMNLYLRCLYGDDNKLHKDKTIVDIKVWSKKTMTHEIPDTSGIRCETTIITTPEKAVLTIALEALKHFEKDGVIKITMNDLQLYPRV